MIKKVKTIVLAMGGLPEIASQVYYLQDNSICIEQYRKLVGKPWPIPYIAPKTCYGRRMLMVNFDCHGMPIVHRKEAPYSADFYARFPDVLWAVGKYEIHNVGLSHQPELTPVWVSTAWDLRKGCCPPDLIRELTGEGEGPG